MRYGRVARLSVALLLALCACGRALPPQTLGISSHAALACSGRIASIALHVDAPVLPLGQRTKVTVFARATPGCPVANVDDRPIALTAEHLSLSAMHLRGGARSAIVRWAPGDLGPTGTIVVQSDGAVARATVRASSGFAFYNVGDNPQTDVTGSQIVAAPDGRLFYGTIGPKTCSANVCTSTQGAIGEFDPRTGRANEIALPSAVLGLLLTSDGALWMSGGITHLIYRMSPGPLATPAAILVPRARGAKNWGAQYFTQDNGGNVWFGDGNGHRLLSIPLAGPYEGSAVVAYDPPSGPAGTPRAKPYVGGLAYGSDGNVYVTDFNNGVLDRVDPASGATTAQIPLPQQRAADAAHSAHPQFAAATDDGIALSLAGSATPPPGNGAIDDYVFGKAIRRTALPKVPPGPIPNELSFDGTYLYYTDVSARGIGFIDETTGRSRFIPTQAFSDVDRRLSPAGVAAMRDGTAWFTCQNASRALQPLCIGHTVYLKRWSLFPGPSFTLDKGASLAQVVGIMESPARNSGPFSARSSNPKVCSASKVTDHNFVVSGRAAGRCTVTVTDAKHVGRSVSIMVIP